MKSVFEKAGIKVAPGVLLRQPEDAQNFIQIHGYPVVVKPDNGVGAYGTYKLRNQQDLDNFLLQKPETPYFMETFQS